MSPLLAVWSLLFAVATAVSARPIWHADSRGITIISVHKDGDTARVEVHPAYLYQRLTIVVPSADGQETVVIRLWEVDNDAPSAPATTSGLRDLDSLARHYRPEFEFDAANGDRLTIRSGPYGYLVMLVSRHATKQESNDGN